MKSLTYTLHGKTALVTGAGSGIGYATAMLLAEAGAIVGVLTHTPKDAKRVAKEIIDAGHQAVPFIADVSDEKAMKRVYTKIKKDWGNLDIVVANAGINGVWAPLEEIDVSEWDKTIAVNLRGTFLTVQGAVPFMKEKGGSVIIVASVNGTRMFSNTGATAYSTSKAGQVAFARMIALELAKHNIRVNTICPGAITTNIGDNTEARHLKRIREPVVFPKGQVPLTHGKSGSARQVADLALFLASEHSSHITGTEVFIDGAQSLLQG